VGAVGTLAAAGGVIWSMRSSPQATHASGAEVARETLSPPWNGLFERPEGGTLAMAALRGQPLVLNFWATWCPPCIEELPALDRFHRDWSTRGWQVVGLAVDSPSAVRSFLVRQPLSFPIGLAGLDGAALSRELGNAQGGLPFTAVFGADGRLRQTKAGQTSLPELEAWARAT
jgi:thiol-disulfide isomerase/thioredoxin